MDSVVEVAENTTVDVFAVKEALLSHEPPTVIVLPSA
jgi:hypothetical protein